MENTALPIRKEGTIDGVKASIRVKEWRDSYKVRVRLSYPSLNISSRGESSVLKSRIDEESSVIRFFNQNIAQYLPFTTDVHSMSHLIKIAIEKARENLKNGIKKKLKFEPQIDDLFDDKQGTITEDAQSRNSLPTSEKVLQKIE